MSKPTLSDYELDENHKIHSILVIAHGTVDELVLKHTTIVRSHYGFEGHKDCIYAVRLGAHKIGFVGRLVGRDGWHACSLDSKGRSQCITLLRSDLASTAEDAARSLACMTLARCSLIQLGTVTLAHPFTHGL